MSIKDLGVGLVCAMIAGVLAVVLLPWLLWQWFTSLTRRR